MKYSITLVAATCALALSACSEPAEVPEAEPAAETEVADAAPMAVDGMPVAGDYVIEGGDGSTINVTLTEDGKAIYTDADGTEMTATYTGGTADEPYCVTGDESGDTSCYAQSMVDGVWTTTSVDDPEMTATITRVMPE